MTAFWPRHPLVRRPREGIISAKMLCYLAIMVELSSETWYTIVNDHADDSMMLYRSGIDEVLDEISHTCLLGLGDAVVPLAYEPGVLGAVGRDRGRFQ